MAILNPEQIRFLIEHRIADSMVFDASGLEKSSRLRAMDVLGKIFYYGGTPCSKGGHTLRSKSGHCIQCSTAAIAYQMRSSASGYVYVAVSPSTSLIKVGFSSLHPQDRGLFLRNEGYGNIKDWDVIRTHHAMKNAGRIEFAVHRALEKFQHPILYEKNPGVLVECREIFKVDRKIALSYFEQATQS